MEVKNTKNYLAKLEDIFSESDYHLRYEKGNFQSGWCVLNDKKIVLVNKYYTTEGKINALQEIIKNLILNPENMSEKNKKLLAQFNQKTLEL
jgi:hypothetical protein